MLLLALLSLNMDNNFFSCSTNFLGSILIVMILVSMASLLSKPNRPLSYMIRRFGLIAIVINYCYSLLPIPHLMLKVFMQLKQEIDYNITKNIPYRDLEGTVSVVTGGDSGIGSAVAQQLLLLGSSVILTCHPSSSLSCIGVVNRLIEASPNRSSNIYHWPMDLSNLTSVHLLALHIKDKFNRLDLLLYSESDNLSNNKSDQLSQLSIGRFALTKWLLPFLMKTSEGDNYSSDLTASGRVVHVLEQPFLPFQEMEVIPLIMLQQLQYKFDLYVNSTSSFSTSTSLPHHNNNNNNKGKVRRLVTAAVYGGRMSTCLLHPLLKWIKTLPLLFRSKEEAAAVVLHALLGDSFTPGSLLDSMRKPHDLVGYLSTDLHRQAFPHVDALPFSTSSSHLQSFRWPQYYWDRYFPHGEGYLFEANRWWDETDSLVDDWEIKMFKHKILWPWSCTTSFSSSLNNEEVQKRKGWMQKLSELLRNFARNMRIIR